jgi:catechol 2,3-dioxygenase-like lactoylglutathione lyase family enzyme
VADLDEAIEFFTAILGGGTVDVEDVDYPHLAAITGYDGACGRIAMVSDPSFAPLLELIEWVSPPQGRVDMETYNVGNTHVAFEVGDIESEFERLRSLPNGLISFRSSGPVRATVGSLTGAKFLYVRGPGGITVEFYQAPGAAVPA